MPPQTKLEQAAEHLRSEIIEGRIRPGDRVVIDQVARELAMSPIPVREAIKQLEAEQLVTIKPHAGAVVTPLSHQDITEVFDLLIALEGVAATHACKHRSLEDLDGFNQFIMKMDLHISANDQRAWVDANIAFHLAIAASAQMPLLYSCTRQAMSRWQRIRLTLFDLDVDENAKAINQEHRQMVRLINERNDSALRALLTSHNNAARTYYLEQRPSDDALPG